MADAGLGARLFVGCSRSPRRKHPTKKGVSCYGWLKGNGSGEEDSARTRAPDRRDRHARTGGGRLGTAVPAVVGRRTPVARCSLRARRLPSGRLAVAVATPEAHGGTAPSNWGRWPPRQLRDRSGAVIDPGNRRRCGPLLRHLDAASGPWRLRRVRSARRLQLAAAAGRPGWLPRVLADRRG